MQARQDMVASQIEAADRGVRDCRVLNAMRQVPRHEFVPEDMRAEAYADHPLPIGCGQTISQPFIVARMIEALALQPGDRVLEIGTGTGYQAAVLAQLAHDVFTVEILPSLAAQARETWARLGITNIHLRVTDGSHGWPEVAPFNAVIVACAPQQVPAPLVAQLAEGGRMAIPVGDRFSQTLHLCKTSEGQLDSLLTLPVRFVPMTGSVQYHR